MNLKRKHRGKVTTNQAMGGPSDGWWEPKVGQWDGDLTDALPGSSSSSLSHCKLHGRAGVTYACPVYLTSFEGLVTVVDYG